MDCADGMTYKANTTGCPATCDYPFAPEECNLPNTEMCVCPEGQFDNNGECVTTCGTFSNISRFVYVYCLSNMNICLVSVNSFKCTISNIIAYKLELEETAVIYSTHLNYIKHTTYIERICAAKYY